LNVAKVKRKSDFELGIDLPEIELPDIGGSYDPNLDPNPTGSYDPRLDPNPAGSYDPRLDPNLPPGQYDPRLDPGVPAPGNSYGGGGQVTMAPGGSGGPGGGAASIAQQLVRALTGGGGDGSAGSILSALLPLLGLGYGAYTQSHASSEAARLAQEGLAHASDQASSILGGAQANFSPYMDAGKAAVGRIGSMPLSNLAANYRPLGSGKGMNLSQIVKG
jgi:hypothetical protein